MKTISVSSGVIHYISINVRKIVLVTLLGVFSGLPALGFGETLVPSATLPAAVSTRILALERQRSLGDGELARYLDSGNVAIATRAALAIGRTKQPAGVALLMEHLSPSNPGERAMVVFALGLLGQPSSFRALSKVIRDPSEMVRYALLDAMGRIGAATLTALPSSAPTGRVTYLDQLYADVYQLENDPSPVVRAKAATIFASFATLTPHVGLHLAERFRQERDPYVRWHIMWTIFRGYANYVPISFLQKGLCDSDETVRIEAVRAYGRLKHEKAKIAAPLIAAMMSMTNDPSWRVQLQARESMRLLRGEKPTEHYRTLVPGLHLPPLKVQKFMEFTPLARPAFSGKPAAPVASDARQEPLLTPRNVAQMNGPLPGKHPRVRIKTTKGTIVLRLYPEWAPLTVANFLNMTKRGYYDGNRWFRIVPDFVVQTGDPNDNGEGDAGFMIGAEENPIEQRTGVVAMGLNYNEKGAIRDSAGTQFYITISPQLHLNNDFTVFGEVESGFEVIARLIESERMTRVEQITDD